MVRNFRLAMAQINPTVGDITGNADKIIEYVSRAREAQAELETLYDTSPLPKKPNIKKINEVVMGIVTASWEHLI